MFLSSYTIIFFVKKLIFSNVYFTEYDIRMFLCFQLRKAPSITYVRNWQGMSSKMRTTVYRGKGCHASCVRTHLHYLFSYFWQHFYPIVSRFVYGNLTLSLLKKDVFVRNGYFSPSLYCHEISFFCETMLAKTLLILIKQNLKYNLYLSMIPYFVKIL